MKKCLIVMLALLLLCGFACAEEYALSHGYRLFEADGKYGLTNEAGAVSLPAEYDEIGGFTLWTDGVYRAAIMKDGLAGWYPAKTDAPVECRFNPTELKYPQMFGDCIRLSEYFYDFDGNRISDQRYYRMWPVNDELAALKAYADEGDTEEDVWSPDYHTDLIFVDRELNELFRLPYDFFTKEADGVLLMSDYRDDVWTNAFADLQGNILYEDHESRTYGSAGSGYYRAYTDGDGYCGLMDSDFEMVIPVEHRWITDFIDGYAVICDAEDRSDPDTRYQCTLINDKLEEVMRFRIGTDLNGVWCNGRIVVNDGDHGLYYVHDMQKKLLLKAKYVERYSGNRFIRYQATDGLWGLIDADGNALAADALEMLPESEGFFAEKHQNGKWTFVGKHEPMKNPGEWDYAESFRDGYAYVRDENGGRFIDTDGNVVRPAMPNLDRFDDDYVPYTPVKGSDGSIKWVYAEARGYRIFTANDGRVGLMDADENILLDAVYDEIRPPVERDGAVYAVLRRGDRYGWYGADGFCDCLWREVKGSFGGRVFAEDYDTSETAMCRFDGSVIEKMTGYAVIDDGMIALCRVNQPASVCDGNFNELFTLDGSPYAMKNGRIRFWKDGKYGFCDAQGQVIVEPVYEYAKDFDENGYATVERHYEDVALIDLDGSIALDFGRYEMIFPFERGCYICRGEDAGIGPSGESGMIIPRAHYDVLDENLNVAASFFGNYLGISANGVISYVVWDESVKYSDDYDFDNPPPSVTHYIYADGSAAPEESAHDYDGSYDFDYYDENGYAWKTGSWIDRDGNAVAPYNVPEQNGWW